MALFAGFLKNLGTQEEFLAPVEASGKGEAMDLLQAAYPLPGYAILTTYEVATLERLITDLKRWPGVASKVQPTLDETLARVSARVGKLPPLVRNLAQQGPQAGTVQSVRSTEIDAMARLMEEQRRLREARLAKAIGNVPAPVAAERRPAPAPAKAAPNPAAVPVPKAPGQGKSVIEVLRALRG